MAASLNVRGILTGQGGKWHVSTVINLLGRLKADDPVLSQRTSVAIGMLQTDFEPELL
jgi:hypothetical protein